MGYINDPTELAQIIAGISDEIATERFIDLANERGGKDNITAIVITVPDDEGSASDVALSYETLANMRFFRGLQPRELLRLQALAKPGISRMETSSCGKAKPGVLRCPTGPGTRA